MLSIAIVTKNEEERLPDCLKSVSFAEDVLVVDSDSTDRTVEIATSLGARVMTEPWRGYSGQKQFAVDHCIHDWVLILDADERIPEETARAIRNVIADSGKGVSAYSFRRRNYLHGRWIKHCGWWPDRIVRLVNRKEGRFDGRRVHESWITQGQVKKLDAPIDHISFRDYSELVHKMENYSNLGAMELLDNNKRVSPFTPALHGAWMFLRTYIMELGVLDGFDGLVISIMNAGGSFLKYAKARELVRSQKSKERAAGRVNE